MKKIWIYALIEFIVIISVLLLLGSCTRDEWCHCVETTNDYEYNRVTVVEYDVDECYEPFTQVTSYRWGSVMVDCR